MPARWTFDHPLKRVEIILEGETTADDARRFLDALEAANAVPYGKLFDATRAIPRIDNQALAVVGSRIATFKNPGPIAIVMPAGGLLEGNAKLFTRAVDVDSRTRVFRTVAEAREWLDSKMRT